MPTTILAGSEAYPRRLAELADPPPVLYATGPLPEAKAWIAIVGSRAASERGRSIAAALARDVAGSGAGVISGGALGIDAAAHRGALDASAPQIVVLPSPIGEPLPKRNRRLFRDVVASRGVLISEIEAPPIHRPAFMMRNRIIAALADAVVVVEARELSGTRHTCDAARRLDRPLFGVRWADGDPRGAGARAIVVGGGSAVDGGRELLDRLGLERRNTDDSDPIMAAIGDGVVAIDRIAHLTRLPVWELLPELSRLELAGRVRLGAGRVQRIA
jgi:DNA processing protein